MSTATRRAATLERPSHARDISLVDLIDRLLDGGVVIHGDITLAVADVDLLYVGLRALVASVNTIEEQMGVRLSAHSRTLDTDALDNDALDTDALDKDALDSDPFGG
jgi:gas vesicle structural protein